MVGEKPQKGNHGGADYHDDNTVEVYGDICDKYTPLDKCGQGIGRALEPPPSKPFQDRQPHGVGSNDLGNGHPPDTNEHELVHKCADHTGNQGSQQNADQVIQAQGVKEAPCDKAANHVQGSVGEIGNSADPIDQCKAQGHQGQGDAVNRAINEDIHGERRFSTRKVRTLCHPFFHLPWPVVRRRQSPPLKFTRLWRRQRRPGLWRSRGYARTCSQIRVTGD